MSAIPAAPSAPVETPTQDAPAPQVEQSTTAPGQAAPETPVTQGTESAAGAEQHADADAIQALAAWRDEQLSAKERQAEYRLNQQRNDLTEQKLRDIELAKADPIVSSAKEVLALARKGFTEGWDDPKEAEAEFKKWLSDTDGFARVMADEELTKGAQYGQKEAFQAASSELLEGLSAEGRQTFVEYVAAEVDGPLIEGKLPRIDAYRKLRQKRDEILYAEYERVLTPIIEARIKEELEAYVKAGGPDAVKVAGRATGGKDDTALLLDPNTSIEQLQEIRRRQLAAG